MARRKQRAPQVYTPTITNPKPTQNQSPTQETEERETQTESTHEQLQELNPKIQLTAGIGPKIRIWQISETNHSSFRDTAKSSTIAVG